jgi:X-X-X-Leu-X-X-Gly heptad repeat protein
MKDDAIAQLSDQVMALTAGMQELNKAATIPVKYSKRTHFTA